MSSRSSEKRITREAIVLRHLRRRREVSLNEAGRLVGISGSAIAHIEQGRMEVSQARLKTLVQAYSTSMREFMELVDECGPAIDLRDECQSIIRQLDESKLAAAHSVLAHLVPAGLVRNLANPKQCPATRKVSGLLDL